MANAPNTAMSGEPSVLRSDAAVQHHFNTEHVKTWSYNPTLRRQRGYQIGTKGYSEPDENAFYAQPGHPQNPEYKPQVVDIEEWEGGAEGEVAVKVSAGEEKWQKYYRERQKMNLEKSS